MPTQPHKDSATNSGLAQAGNGQCNLESDD